MALRRPRAPDKLLAPATPAGRRRRARGRAEIL